MHRIVKEALSSIKGVSEDIIAVNLDIRGLSRFSLSAGPEATADYLGKVYQDIIDGYFTGVSFFKTTGDGLLLIIPYTEDNLRNVATRTIYSCLHAVQEFAKISVKDSGIDYDVPGNIGIGLSRGPACRLVSGDKTLDYFGKATATASKLMNIARPSGIVLDDGFDIGVLSREEQELFTREIVYLTGIAERQPIDIWYTSYFTEILPVWKRPVPIGNWKTIEDIQTLTGMKAATCKGHWVRYVLPSTPCNYHATKVQVEYPALIEENGSEMGTMLMDFSLHNHVVQGNTHIERINFAELADKLSERGVKDDWEFTIRIRYQQK